jgi:AraC-like DNA-binding protein
MIVAIGQISRRLSGRELRATQTRFTHARPAHAAQLEALFGAPAVFGASEIALEFPAIYLDLPLLAQEGSIEEIEARARACVDMLPAEEGLLSRLRAWVALRLQEEPSLADAARDLGLGPRTLQRRLRDFGTSFQNELDVLRRQIGRERVLVSPSVGQLAASLGFRDASAFTRAFRRWTGESPRDFRARLQT